MCLKNFEYSPGPAGNARQFCEECRRTVDEEELQRIEEEMVTEGNRYLMDAPKRKDEFDPLEILMEGNFPEFKSDADRFVCVMELAKFINSNGFSGNERNVMLFKKRLGTTHSTLFEINLDVGPLEHLVSWCFKNEGIG